MPTWLYNSKGRPIAFVKEQHVFTRRGRFFGVIEGDEVWNGQYLGSIVEGDLLLYKMRSASETRDAPNPPGSPGVPGVPSDRAGRGLRSGYRDVAI